MSPNILRISKDTQRWKLSTIRISKKSNKFGPTDYWVVLAMKKFGASLLILEVFFSQTWITLSSFTNTVKFVSNMENCKNVKKLFMSLNNKLMEIEKNNNVISLILIKNFKWLRFWIYKSTLLKVWLRTKNKSIWSSIFWIKVWTFQSSKRVKFFSNVQMFLSMKMI